MRFSPRIIGNLAAYVAKTIHMTMSVQKIQHPSYCLNTPSIYAFWHGDLLVDILTVKKMVNHPISGFVSTSRDGDILEAMLQNLNYEVVRGSTSKGAISGAVKLLKHARKGHSLGIAPDGPRGPRFHVSEGVIFLAEKSKLPVVPLGLHINRYKTFEKSWDKFKLPGLFSKAVLYFGEPIFITGDTERLCLKQQLMDASEIAKAWASGKRDERDVQLVTA